ncbi:hypothetical protein Z517_00845 [Fonsecaea pedrosoi CBS 271.37]|uniref:Xylanolytic transcriptional activator regulatory domain-containing protein n=1 Tax=Fonsecaea pedrosoi CBS 271.37 TaxID=1442368 RepID=A0A0D2H3L3_9EURO|nr:uncharacterized protein Z517_00845 [Fonsecaea pedrosoi CBS 271.37]KIW85455.1 hypothetical protein Z517_00845 [Fonsecaea pedrosoi CBS 271.37]
MYRYEEHLAPTAFRTLRKKTRRVPDRGPILGASDLVNQSELWPGVLLETGDEIRNLGDRSVIELPGYVQPAPGWLWTDEFQYLISRGAFRMPPPPLLRELISSYVEWVHPVCPIVETRVVNSVLALSDHPKISLLLLQALIYAGSVFIEEGKLRLFGLADRFTAQTVFFERVKLLFDFNYECDRLCLLQTTILMSFSQDWSRPLKDSRYYLNLAHSIALLMGLSEEDTYAKYRPDINHRLRRIWWSLYCRDKFVAISTMQPPLIKGADFHVDPPTLPANNLVPTGALSTFRKSFSPGQDKDPKLETDECQFTLPFVEQTRLCLQIGRVLDDLYYPVSVFTEPAHPGVLLTARLVPQATVRALQQSLTIWWENLEHPLRLSLLDMDGEIPMEPYQKRRIIHGGLLSMFYFATSMALHRWLTMLSIPGTPLSEGQSCNYLSLESDSHMILHVWNIVSSIDVDKVVGLGGHLCVIEAINTLGIARHGQHHLLLSAARIRDMRMCLQTLKIVENVCQGIQDARSTLEAMLVQAEQRYSRLITFTFTSSPPVCEQTSCTSPPQGEEEEEDKIDLSDVGPQATDFCRSGESVWLGESPVRF